MPVTEPKPDMTILMLDRENNSVIPAFDFIHILDNPDMNVAESAHNVFVLSTEGQLHQISDFVRVTNRRNQLRALLIREEDDARWLTQLLDIAAVRTLRNTHVHSGRQVPSRILNAWANGAQDDLIANATVRGDILLILSCNMNLIQVPFAQIPVLSRLPLEERAKFNISADGSYIHWPKSDIDVDLEGLRTALDPKLKARTEHERLIHDQNFGAAVARFRQQLNLRQSDISGLSERQVRRIEAGESASSDAIRHLAKAHKMDANAYMGELATAIAEGNLKTPRVRSRRAKQAGRA